MQNIHVNPQRTYPYKQACILVASHTGYVVHTNVFFPLPWPTQANSPTRTWPFHWHSWYILPHPQRFLRGHLEATQLSCPLRVHSSPQVYREATHLSHLLRANSCPQGHLKTTWLPRPHRANCFQKYIWWLINFPAHSGLIPVHKDLWRILTFPTIPTRY